MLSIFKKSISEEQRAFFANESPLILMGRGHSGTRVFSLFCHYLGFNLAAENKVKTGDASDLKFTGRIKKIAHKYLVTGNSTKGIESLKHAVWAYFQNLSGEKELWGWKFPETYLIGALVSEVFPRARYVHIVRDGRDVAFKKHQTDRKDRKLGRKILTDLGVLDDARHIQAGLSWKYQVDEFDKWKTCLRQDQIHEVRFEDFIAEPQREGQRICDFLNMEMTEEARTYINTQINSKKIAQHTEEKRLEVAEIEARIMDTLRRWRYLD